MRYAVLLARFNIGGVLRRKHDVFTGGNRYTMGPNVVTEKQAMRLLAEAKPYHDMPSAQGGCVFFKNPSQAPKEAK